ncbi:MAG: PAS domain S-box protein [Planctomycetaceae bacterium]|nr:PAS domain S-box protein [Planctomycetaceae bacterium]
MNQPIFEELEDRQFDLATFLNFFELPGVLVDRTGHVSSVNQGYYEYFGESEPDPRGRDWFDEYVPMEFRELHREILNNAESITEQELEEFPVINLPQGDRVLHWKCRLVRERDGNCVGMLCLGVDATAQFTARQGLREKSRRLEQAETLAKLGHWEHDFSTREHVWSDQMYRIAEVDRQDFQPSCDEYLTMIHPMDRERVERTSRESIANRTSYEIAYRLQMADGRIKFVREVCETQYNELGEPQRGFGTIQDVTEEEQAREELLFTQRAIESSSASIAFLDLNGKFRFVNDAFLGLFGYERLEDLSKILGESICEDPEEGHKILTSISQGKAFTGKLKVRRRDGTRVTVSVFADLVRDQNGEPCGYMSWAIDETPRLQAAAALERERRWSDAVIRNAPVCIKLFDRDGRLMSINQTGLEYMEVKDDRELVGKLLYEFLEPQYQKEWLAGAAEAWKGRTVVVGFALTSASGKRKQMETTLSPIFNEEGTVAAMLSITKDITEQAANAERLKKSQEKITTLLSQLPVTIVGYGMDGVITLIEGLASRLLGATSSELLGRNVFDVYARFENFIRSVKTVLSGQPHAVTCERGSQAFEIRQSPVYNSAGNQTGVLAIVIDVTQQVSAARELSRATLRFDSMVNAITEGVLFVDEDGFITEANPSAERILGISREELVGLNVKKQVEGFFSVGGNPYFPEEHPAIKVLRTGEPQRDKLVGVHAPHGRVWMLMNAEPIIQTSGQDKSAVVVSFTDVTLRREAIERERDLREKLTHSLRVNVLGELASGLAHELTQPLTAIAGYSHSSVELVSRGDQGDPELLERLLKLVYRESLRAGDIIKRLRSAVQKKKPTLCSCEIRQLIDETQGLLKYEFKRRGVRLEWEPEENPAYVLVDPIQVQQVLVNLVRNALDAIGTSSNQDPFVRISVGRAKENPEELVVIVQDNGPGVADELRGKIFEPYLTTKDSGLGLGLPISRSLIESLEGRLWLDETLPSGTRFCFTLRLGKSGVSAEL